MTQLFAQPYDISANGFYFDTVERYDDKAKSLRNSYGEPVEEFEIQFIDGDDIDAAVFDAVEEQLALQEEAELFALLEPLYTEGVVELWDENDEIDSYMIFNGT